MQVLVLGGSGRTGKLITKALLDRGHSVTVAGRRDPVIEGARFIQADLMRPAEVQQAAEGMDAVISALASDKGNPVCSAVAEALSQQEDLRFITIGGAGVDADGDQKGPMDKLIGWMMRRVAAEMLADRQKELGVLQASRLQWTMLRPPRLTDQPATASVRTTFDRPAFTAITRSDLTNTVVEALTSPAFIGRAPFVAG